MFKARSVPQLRPPPTPPLPRHLTLTHPDCMTIPWTRAWTFRLNSKYASKLTSVMHIRRETTQNSFAGEENRRSLGDILIWCNVIMLFRVVCS